MDKIVIRSYRGAKPIDWHDLKRYKDLLYFMVLRDVTVVYKQTVMGFAWAIVNPLISMLVFTIVFGKLAGVTSDGIPYPLFSFSALVPWTYFSNAMNASSSSLISSSSLLGKVYFPRIYIPLTPALSKLVDFSISFLVLLVFLFIYKQTPDVEILAMPLLILLLVATVAGMGFWFSSLAVQYRDVRFAISFLTPLLMYAAPVVFPASLVMEKAGYNIYLLYGLYPMTGVIEGFRGALLEEKAVPWDLLSVSALSATFILLTGWHFFRRTERYFADVA
ncbi:MAG: ABC transporter permease [Sphingobacteriales bacterium]|nr:MAG: ABC transporter permease [Sphingobacteriales bacterium]